MNKAIYSLYIDIPEHELDNQKPYFWDYISKSQRTKLVFKENYKKLLDVKNTYSQQIGVDFHMFEYDENYKQYEQFFKTKYPQITTYNIVNFYKIHLLYNLANQYDQILYLDFDVIPVTKESFFDVWDFSKGICLYNNNDNVNRRKLPVHMLQNSVRSPTAKYYNAQAMLHHQGFSGQNDVINTGIVGVSNQHLADLKYFDNFEQTLDLMSELRQGDGMYPPNVVNMFGYDNETIMSYKIKTNNVPVQWLDTYWHHFYDVEMYIPNGVKMIHAINKRFDFVWRYYEKNNL